MEACGAHCAVLGSLLRLALVLALGLSACATATANAPPEPVSVVSPPPAMPVDPIIGADKIKHFFIAGFVESVAFAGTQAVGSDHSTARPVAIGAVAAASIGRELYDRRTKGLFSFRDLAWDALGAGAALLVLNKTQR
jgi:hypothetical protein